MATITKRKRKDGGLSWDAQVRVTGYGVRCKSFRSKTEAEVWASRTESAAHGRTLALGAQVTLSMLLDEAEPHLRNPPDAALKYWRREIGHMRLRDINTPLLANHRDRLLGAPTRSHGQKRSKPRSAGTVRSYFAVLAQAFKFGIRELRWTDQNPVYNVQLPPPAAGVIRFLSEDERTALFVACKASASPTLYACVLMAYTTGARRGEICSMRWADVDLRRRWAIFPKTKNGDARGVPLTPAVVAELEKLPRSGDRVFPCDLTAAWATTVKRSSIAHFRFHDLRHSAASRMVQSGANLSEVAQLLGHKTIQMTMTYSHIHSEHTQALVDRIMGEIG